MLAMLLLSLPRNPQWSGAWEVLVIIIPRPVVILLTPAVILPGMNLACPTAEKDLRLGSAESEGVEGVGHLFSFSRPGQKELKAPWDVPSPASPSPHQQSREHKEVRQKDLSCSTHLKPPHSQTQAPSRAQAHSGGLGHPPDPCSREFTV